MPAFICNTLLRLKIRNRLFRSRADGRLYVLQSSIVFYFIAIHSAES